MTSASRISGPARRALLIVSVVGLAACSGSTASTSPAASSAVTVPSSSAAASPSAAPSPSAPASPSAAASASPSAATAVPTSIDPCQLIPSGEAGQLAGATFGAGKESTTAGGAKMCTYGAQTKNVFEVIVAVAPDVATAKAEEAAAEADYQAQAAQVNQGLTVTQLPGFAPNTDAVLLEMKPNALSISGRSMAVLRGTDYFAFSDLVLGGSAPSADAMKAEAMTVLGRLP